MILLNGHVVKPTIFPDKTSQVWKVSGEAFNEEKRCEIKWDFESEDELIHVAQLKQLASRFYKKVDLYMPYLPYGRQDKEVGNYSTFALNTFATLINSLKFNQVFSVDSHSPAAKNLIKNYISLSPSNHIIYAANDTAANLICYPDKGALNKYSKAIKFPFISADKNRDQLTGKITSYKLNGRANRKRVLIVDDICDGGATFVLLADRLKKGGAMSINLYVTHGIFSKGVQVLKDAGINKIYTLKGEVHAHSTNNI